MFLLFECFDVLTIFLYLCNAKPVILKWLLLMEHKLPQESTESNPELCCIYASNSRELEGHSLEKSPVNYPSLDWLIIEFIARIGNSWVIKIGISPIRSQGRVPMSLACGITPVYNLTGILHNLNVWLGLFGQHWHSSIIDDLVSLPSEDMRFIKYMVLYKRMFV